MYLSELYSAMVEKEPDELAQDRRRRQLTRPAAAPSPKDIEQDAHIRLVERENLRVKKAFASLVHLLVEKQLLDETDVRKVVEEAVG